VVQLYKTLRVMYAEIKDKLSADADAASYIVNETRELSLDDLISHTEHDYDSRLVFLGTSHHYPTWAPGL